MQTKLHQWAVGDPDRRFDDLYNLVHDPAFLVVAWSRVRSNKGARSAGVDGIAPKDIGTGAKAMLEMLRAQLKARSFVPTQVREKTIPKASGKVRRLGIANTPDRVVQAVLKLVLEPIFEADFKPCSYGFRPKRRAHDALAEIHYLGSPTRSYEWVFEADITACFDEISHSFLLGRMRGRIADKRVMRLVAAFLRAGILSEDGVSRDTLTGALLRAGSSRRAWLTSPCRCWMSTSRASGKSSDRTGCAPSAASRASRPIAWSAMRTTSW
jgi:RNA-directed DNA polymerase